MDVQQLSPRLNEDSADVGDRPVAPVLDPAVPLLKQGEHHDSCLSAPNAEEMATPMSSSAPAMRSQTTVTPEKSPIPALEGRYVAGTIFRYKDGNGEVDYDIQAIIKELSSKDLTAVTKYPDRVRYECYVSVYRWDIYPGLLQFLKETITSDEYIIRILAIEVRYQNEPALAALIRVRGLQLKKPGLFGLACLLAEFDGIGVARYFEEFSVTDPQECFSVALACLEGNPRGVPDLLGNFRLTYTQRLQLALAMLESAAEEVCEYIANYDLADEMDRINVALACIPQGARFVVRNFRSFGITDQRHIEILAQACGLADGEETAENVGNFGLKNQKFIRQLGLVCAREDGSAAEYFQNFGCDDLDYKMRFSMACAQSNGWATAANVEEFEFPDDTQTRAFLWRLALACVNQNCNAVDYIYKFGMLEPDRLYQLGLKGLKNGARRNVPVFKSIFPELYESDGKRHLGRKVAPINLEGSTKQVVTLLLITDQNCGFYSDIGEDNAWLLLGDTLAAMQQYPAFRFFARNFFGGEYIPDPLLTLDEGGRLPHEAVCDAMKVFGGGGPLATLSAPQIAALAQIDSTNFSNYFRIHAKGDLVPQTKLDNPIARLKKAGIVLTSDELKAALSVVTQGNKDQVFLQARNKAFLQEVVNLLKHPKEPGKGPKAAAALKADAKWTRDVLIQIDLHEFSAELVNALLPLLKAIHSLRDLRVRKDLTALVFETSPQLLALWQKEADKVKPQNAIPLLCVLPYLAQQPSLKEALDSDAKTKSPRLDNYKASRPFIKAFRTLQESELGHDTKSGILKSIFPEAKPDIDTIIARMRKLNSLLGLSEERAEKLTQPDNTQSLDALLTAALEERLALKKPLNLEVFQKTFGSYREPDTLLVYAGRIAGRTRPMEGLREFVEAVLEGRYPAIRYEQAGLFAGCSPAFVEKWKTNRRVAFNEVIATSSSSSNQIDLLQTPSARYFRLISDEILRDNHLPMARGGLLESYLRDKTKAAQLLGITNDNEASADLEIDVMPVNTGSTFAGVNSTRSSSSSSSNTSSSDNPALHEFQRQCIAFLEAPTLEALHGLKASLAALDPTSELNQALAVMEADMLGVDRDHDHATLSFVFTDDHQQIMRMGSDMDGSCQRIDGDPRLNQGVVGTIHDGNSRLCLIEGEDGVIIGRAILRRVSIEAQDKDCLLMEPIYPPLLSEELSTALTHWATLCAIDLGLDMAVLTKDKSLPDCTDTLVSGPLRYALYSDGAGGIVDSAFRIDSLSAQRQENRLAWRHRNADAAT